MKQIPCLSSDFPEWDWENPVNNVTDDFHIQLAYSALTTGGLTLNFTVNTWNSIVAWINQMCKTSGISWDDAFGDLNSVKIAYSDDDRILTAKRWNAIVHNISGQIATVWKWENDPSKIGYTGRRYMQQNDLLYGWYILDLVSEINRLITICKGDSAMADFLAKQSYMTSTNATIRRCMSGRLTYAKNIKSPFLADLNGFRSASISSKIESSISHESKLLFYKPGIITALCRNGTHINGTLHPSTVGEMLYQDTAKTKYKADLELVMHIGSLISRFCIISEQYAKLVREVPAYKSGISVSEDNAYAVISQMSPYLLFSRLLLTNNCNAELLSSDVKRLNFKKSINSCDLSDLKKLVSGIFYAQNNINSIDYARIRAGKSGWLYTMINTASDHKAELSSPVVRIYDSVLRSKANIASDLTGAFSKKLDARFISKFESYADVMSIMPAYTFGTLKSRTFESAKIASAEPKKVFSFGTDVSQTNSELNIEPVLHLTSQEKESSRVAAVASRRSPKPMNYAEKLKTLCYANLTIEKETNWIYTVQEETDVHIYSAYPHQSGTNIRLGKGKDNG